MLDTAARLAVTLLLTSVFGVMVASAAFAQDKIVFSSTRGGTPDADIYVMNADGGAQTRLTTGPASDVQPTWSPDGKRLAFTRIGFTSRKVDVAHIWVMNADGSGQTQLTNAHQSDTYPAWSPDATQVAFTRANVNKPETSEVFVMNADGKNLRKLTSSRGVDGFPSWSPDGSKIAFTSDRDGNPEIYTINADGSGQTRLTNNDADDTHPAWSQDGSRIAFISDRDGRFQLYVMPAGGGTQQRLTPLDEDVDPSGENAPTWSPDGTTIAYTADLDDVFEIVTIGSGGGGVRILPGSPVGFAPDWQRPAGTPPPTATLLAPQAGQSRAVDGLLALLAPANIFSETNVFGEVSPRTTTLNRAAGPGRGTAPGTLASWTG